VFIEALEFVCCTSGKISLIHNAAFCCCTRGLLLTAAVWHVLKTQRFAIHCFWKIACRDTVLIGNLPMSLLPLPRHAFCRGARPTAFCRPGPSQHGITAGRDREGLGKQNQALNVSYATDYLYHGSCYHARPHARRMASGSAGVRRGEHRTDMEDWRPWRGSYRAPVRPLTW
jgi:hypothetical protein